MESYHPLLTMIMQGEWGSREERTEHRGCISQEQVDKRCSAEQTWFSKVSVAGQAQGSSAPSMD